MSFITIPSDLVVLSLLLLAFVVNRCIYCYELLLYYIHSLITEAEHCVSMLPLKMLNKSKLSCSAFSFVFFANLQISVHVEKVVQHKVWTNLGQVSYITIFLSIMIVTKE